MYTDTQINSICNLFELIFSLFDNEVHFLISKSNFKESECYQNLLKGKTIDPKKES